MANFKITVEPLNPDMEVSEEMRKGMVCDGYFLATDTEDGNTVAINNLNTIDVAFIIAKSTELLEAAIIARAINEAMQMVHDRKTPKAVKINLAQVLEQIAGDD